MSKDAMLPCIICGVTLSNAFEGSINPPEEGTEFRTFGHYGSTFWDSFGGEEIAINICDECLGKHQGRIGRHKRYVNLVVTDSRGPIRAPTLVGRQWVEREMVPYFDGPEDVDQIAIEPEEIGVLAHSQHIEWVANWRSIKAHVVTALAEEEGTGPCMHNRFVAECLDCGAKPLEGLR
jgi:hypothetical protein